MFKLIYELNERTKQQRGGGRRRRYKRRSRKQKGGGGSGFRRAVARGKMLKKDPRWLAYLHNYANYLERRGDRRSKYIRMMAYG